MRVPVKLAAFAATLAVLLGAGALAGGAIDPNRGSSRQHVQVGAEHGSGHGPAAESARPIRGLAVAEDGLRLVVERPELRRRRAEQLRFRVVGDSGATVRDFAVAHEKRMHLIVVRRDLTAFQHLHPEQHADGGWTVDVRLDDAGSYRVFADFTRSGKPHTLAADLRVDGPVDLAPLPAPVATSVSNGGYDVRLDAGRVSPGEEADLRFTITKEGAGADPEPYLGAGGHLVALREGDLGFLHVHPTEHGAGRTDAVGFAATFPTAGSYRLFLQFKHEGRVQTVAFTQEVSA